MTFEADGDVAIGLDSAGDDRLNVYTADTDGTVMRVQQGSSASDYDAMIEIYTRWQNPPLHMYTQLAAAYAQLGRMGESRTALESYQRLRLPDADFAYYLAAHARLCKRPEDAEHWTEGYRKGGLID